MNGRDRNRRAGWMLVVAGGIAPEDPMTDRVTGRVE